MDSDGGDDILDREMSNSEAESITEDAPGARVLWFGQHSGKRRLDEVGEGYIAWACHPKRRHQVWYNEFKQLCEEYRRWREEHYPTENPGSAIVWWGKYEWQEFRKMYAAYGHMRYVLQPRFKGCRWYFWLKNQTQRYQAWLDEHRRPARARVSTGYRRDIGERVDSRDDKPPPQEEYERDDFLVSDDDNDSDADIDSEEVSEDEVEETLSDELKNLQDEQDTGQSSTEDTADEAIDRQAVNEGSTEGESRCGDEADGEDDECNAIEDENEGDADADDDDEEDADDESDFDVQYDLANKKARQQSALDKIKKSIVAKRPSSSQLVSPKKRSRSLSSDEEESVQARTSRVRRKTIPDNGPSLDTDSDSDEDELPSRLTQPAVSNSKRDLPRRSARLRSARRFVQNM